MSALHAVRAPECPKVPVGCPTVTDNERTRVPGAELRRLRLEQRMTVGQLARLVHVDPRTVTRWETAEFIPDKAVPALRTIFRFGDEEEPDEPDDPPVSEASPQQLMNELMRRIERTERRPAHELPDVPTGRYRFPKSAGPSARTRHANDQGEPEAESAP